MAPEELERLSREELLELIRRQREKLAERDAAIERREAKIRELEEELAQLRRPAKTPENSSLPPSKGHKANATGRRGHKRGPKRGHRGSSRRRDEPDGVVVERARPTYDALRERVRGSPVINSDETGARVDGQTRWLWVFQTPEASYHVIAPSRGGEVIGTFLDGVAPEVWVADLWAPQVGTAA